MAANAEFTRRNQLVPGKILLGFFIFVFLTLACGVPVASAQSDDPLTIESDATQPEEEVRVTPDAARISVSEDTTDTSPRIVMYYALVVSVIGAFIAWLRIVIRFQQFWGLGVTTNVYAISLIVVIGGLSGVFYLFFATRAVDPTSLPTWIPRINSAAFSQTFTIIGGSVAGQVATLIGRFVHGGRVEGLESKQVKEFRKIQTPNFIYTLIRESIATSIHKEISKLAQTYDWNSIQSTAVGLITDQVTTGNMQPAEGESIIKRINETEEVEDERQQFQTNYSTLSHALRVCGFRQLVGRFGEVAG